MKKQFTLVEILMAMGLFAVAVSSLLGVMARSTQIYVDTAGANNTPYLLRELMLDIDIDQKTQATPLQSPSYPSLYYRINKQAGTMGLSTYTIEIGNDSVLDSTSSLYFEAVYVAR
ncbi:MAG: hypothetical protein HQL32_08580 [Planctomycetes bacterium]|nr:hypothetical protein [Planctomycetota bacterium]